MTIEDKSNKESNPVGKEYVKDASFLDSLTEDQLKNLAVKLAVMSNEYREKHYMDDLGF
ncbi:MAG: hypothetical protein AABW50_02190 [Nanoarchaeota archaeon]